jgi:hypothetical protein
VALLQGKKKWEDRELVGLGVRSAALKGDPRVVVDCGVVEKLVFGARGEGQGEFSFPQLLSSSLVGLRSCRLRLR